eukprot:CAMPEP_0181484670 /NCGR_PEP_ID=MMETSP1110-20121109/46128_1 /TAXON_ID=174948 /ORGANISM="Symbiodinium sp., Strain CCMP421" /LENGTH=313 /DNA_ID=CAMNT_0023610563 /DNA_START=144 /DNA_END=1085 /DNA_ORIENTATION=+
MAHLSSILQMCCMYAESRPTQAEALQQLKQHVEKLNLLQKKILQKKQRRMSQARVRQMRPLPAIMASDGSAGSSELLELPEQPRRAVSEHLEESLRGPRDVSGDLESSLDCRPIVKSKKRAQTVPSDEQEGSGGASEARPPEASVELAEEAVMCQEPSESIEAVEYGEENLLSFTFSLPREDVASAPQEDAPNLPPQVDCQDLDCEMLASLTQGTQGGASARSAPEGQRKQDTGPASASDKQRPKKAKAKTNWSVASATSNTSKPLTWLASLGRRFLPQKGAAAAKVSPEDSLVGAVGAQSTPVMPRFKSPSE